jgi:hypothetical protein
VANGGRSIEQMYDDYPAEFRFCREHRHALVDREIYIFKDGRKQYVVLLVVCDRCEYTVEHFYDTKGNYEFSHRRYPRGYLMKYSETERRAGTRLTGRKMQGVVVRRAFRAGGLTVNTPQD